MSRVLGGLLLLAGAQPASWAAAPGESPVQAVTVSPGGPAAEGLTAAGCPTFSWGLLLSDAVELGVYRVWENGTVDWDAAVLEVRLPGTVTTWTPPSNDCFAAGERYAWSVRGASRELTDWSEPRYFTVRLAPSDEEIEQALEVLRRARGLRTAESLLNTQGTGRSGPSGDTAAVEVGAAPSSSQNLTPPVAYGIGSEVSGSDTAAIYGKNATGGRSGFFDGDVEVAGGLAVEAIPGFFEPLVEARVLGASTGIAVQGVGDDGGVGRLGTGNNGVWGETSNPTGSAVFGHNTAGGKAGQFTGQVVVDGDLEVMGSLSCADCIGETEIDGGAVTEHKLAAGAVTNHKIAFQAVTHAKIGPLAVHAGNISNGNISTDKLAVSAVTEEKIADGAVGSSKLGLGLYRSKADLYLGLGYVDVPAGGTATANAACQSSEDLPINGWCESSPILDNTELLTHWLYDWVDLSEPAGTACQFRNNSSTTTRASARILCVRSEI